MIKLATATRWRRWWHTVDDDARRSLVRRGVFDVDARDAATAYQMMVVWIGDGAGRDRARRALLGRLATAMSVSAGGHVGGAD